MTNDEKITYLVLRGWRVIGSGSYYVPIHRVIHIDYSGWYYLDSAIYIEENGIEAWEKEFRINKNETINAKAS